MLGGEQSGHVIFRDHAVTGDGPLTGILLLEAMVRSGRPLHELAAVVTKYPQVLENVRVARREDLDGATGFWDAVRAVEAELGGEGRVLVRPSGTEPVVRVMVEAADAATAAASPTRSPPRSTTRWAEPMAVVERASRSLADADAVWAWVTTAAGVNDELRPWLRMTVPAGWRDRSIADVTPGTRIGRSWILLLGVIPFDADDLTIVEIGPRHFVERSPLLSAASWQHERTVTPHGRAGCRLADRLTFEPRALAARDPGRASGSTPR